VSGDLLVKIAAVAIPLVEALGILTAVHATWSVRTSQGAIAWAISLVTFPWVALPLYWIFGRSRFSGYVETLRHGLEEHATRVAEVLRLLDNDRACAPGDLPPEYAVFAKLVHWPFNDGNRVDLLVDGEATFSSMFDDIARAESYVLLEYFIVHDDDLGRELRTLLVRKAREGVRVFFLFDEIGSHSLPKRYLRELREAGVDIRSFHTTKGRRNRFQLNFRNHRKITIIDGKVAYVGGHNVGDEYMGRDPRFGHWRDTHIRVTGPAVRNVQLVFLGDWYWSTRTAVEVDWVTDFPGEGKTKLLVLPTGPADTAHRCSLFFLQAIQAAKSRIWITSPYFVPDDAIVEALHLAALRGVDVRILLPEKPDHKIVYLASFHYLAELDIPGVRFFRFEPGFLHQKVLLVDHDLAAVGTANLDNRSFHLNFEITMIAHDREFASRVEGMLEHDFARSRHVTIEDYRTRSFPFKVGVRLARLLSPIL